ncbi:tRNA-intron lyase [Halobaculum sp. D14]|uniref:tRNA-intron lyase n=1 Tax=unclassified Halobaculum TaxID=2640896 RepID=UPI003EBFE784
MEATLDGGVVTAGGDARQRFHDSRGYGRARGAEVDLARVEAAHLLYRGDIDAVDGMGFREFFVDSVRAADRFAARFLTYADVRERGFYVSPTRDGWPGGAAAGSSGGDAGGEGSGGSGGDRDSDRGDGDRDSDRGDGDRGGDVDFAVYARGEKPGGDVAYRLRVVGERAELAADRLDGVTLAVVDEESEVTYFDCTAGGGFDGATDYDLPRGVEADLLDDRAVCWEPPASLYGSAFYGQPVSGRDAAAVDALQLSLLEAADLAERGAVDLDADDVVARGRDVEGDRFDRRLGVYRRLRDRGVVPKTGYKFGADFRTYDDVDSVESLPHSEALVRVVPADHRFDPRELALDVRLAGGVRKRMVFALAGDDSVAYLTVARLTP